MCVRARVCDSFSPCDHISAILYESVWLLLLSLIIILIKIIKKSFLVNLSACTPGGAV